jgi:hypothetical protein
MVTEQLPIMVIITYGRTYIPGRLSGQVRRDRPDRQSGQNP